MTAHRALLCRTRSRASASLPPAGPASVLLSLPVAGGRRRAPTFSGPRT